MNAHEEAVSAFLLAEEGHIRAARDRVDFLIEGFHVEPAGYREIGHLIRQGRITVGIGRRSAGSRVSAVYTALRNHFSISEGMDLQSARQTAVRHQSEIFHEATHALMDYHGYRASGLIQEMAAYLAGTLYGYLHGFAPSGDSIPEAAVVVITTHGLQIYPGRRLSLEDAGMPALAEAIRSHTDAYPDPDAVVETDGIRGGLVNPWYRPRYQPGAGNPGVQGGAGERRPGPMGRRH